MTPIAATIALILLFTLGYAAVCAAQPFARCGRCNGFGFATTTDRKGRPKRGKTCRRCKGHGKRIRVGRHLYNLWLHVYRDGTDTPTPTAAKRPAPKG